nr:putative phage tail protein [Eikenella sp. Marseille-P7795]
MGAELKTYYRWLLDNTLPLNRIAQFEALSGSRYISEYLSVLHGDRVVIEIPRGRKGKAADIAQVQSQTAEAIALLAKWHEDGSGVDETIEALTNVLSLLAYAPTAGGDITRWERLLGLNPPQPDNYARRVADVLAKLNETGGLSIPYFVGLAAAAGYTITISEPQPFRAGINRAGDRLAREDIMWVWWVDVAAQSQTVWRFRAGSGTAGSRLSQYSDAVIESLFNRLKPAHTAIRFTYR